MKMLEGLVWHPSWMSLMGCFKGCMDYLGRDESRAWIAGGCGHAFAINVHEQLCPSGPTAWQRGRVLELGANVGWVTEPTMALKDAGDFAAKQREAFDMICAHLDEGVPCWGWEMPIPEYYVICGHTDDGYLTMGPGRCDKPSEDPVPWQNVGMDIGVLEVGAFSVCDPAPDDVVVREALALALEFSEGLHAHDNWTMGLGAFDLWADALGGGVADRFGLGYNSECWAESRADAAAFLREAQDRLPEAAGALPTDAADRYFEVHQKLAAVSKLYPFDHPTEGSEPVQDADAAALVREAKAAEEQGVAVLRELVAAL